MIREQLTGAVGAILAVSLLANLAAGIALRSAWGANAKQSAKLTLASDANAEAAKVIGTLQSELNKANRELGKLETDKARIEREHADELARLANDNSGERAARDELYATDTECAALARVPVCGALADRLRARAHREAGTDRD